ncbi:MAG: hypothetical protein CMQ34_00865 [Gammaproteobacteria bacterium]|nr:hypothetical protein [Gammaproteobacteria bacterium]
MHCKPLMIVARTAACRWLMLLLFAVTGVQAGQEADQQSGQDVPAPVPDAAREPAEDPLLIAQRQTQLARAQALQAQIDDLSVDLGSYDPALIELQDDLGRTYLDLKEFALAHGVLEQAMQLVRVNDGLYGERQVELLKSLVQANLGLQDWEQVDIYAHLLFDLQSRLHERNSSAYTDAMITFSDWRLQASRYNLLSRRGASQSVQELQDLQKQHEQVLTLARERQDVRQQWALLYAMAAAEIELARQYNYQSLSDFNSPAPRYVSQTVCRTVPNASGGFQRVCWQERVSNPDYMYSASSQRRNQTERARIALQATVREMEALLADNPAFAEAHAAETGAGLQNIEKALKDLQRDARRSSLQRW